MNMMNLAELQLPDSCGDICLLYVALGSLGIFGEKVSAPES